MMRPSVIPVGGRVLAPLLLLLAVPACGGDPGTPPVADAGEDVVAAIGHPFGLDGRSSSDADGDALAFSWSVLDEPSGSDLELRDADTATPSATPGVAGDVRLELTVSDGHAEARDRVTVTVVSGPDARAGDDAVVPVGSTVELDGRGSSDPEGAALAFEWTFTSRPSGSDAEFHDATSRTPRFTADEAGDYEIGLTVSNGGAEAADSVTVRANQAPTADAGTDQEVRLGDTATVAGSGSDPDGDALAFAWTFVSVPTGSTAPLQDETDAVAEFAPDVEGDYVLALTASDGHLEDDDTVTVTVIPASGTVSSELFVAPDGDDADPGTETSPLRTLGAALDRASANPDIARIRFAGGTYDAEPYDYEVDTDLQLVGPEDGGPAVLVAPDDLLGVVGDASVVLLRLSLQAGGTAVDVATNAKASLVAVDCVASSCVQSGLFLISSGGSVTVTRSHLSGTGTGTAAGIHVSAGDGVVVTDTTIEGFFSGVTLVGTNVTLRDSTLRDNETGMVVLAGASTEVRRGTFDGNGVGLRANSAAGVTLLGLSIEGSTSAGIEVEAGSAIRLEDVLVQGGGGDGIVIDEGDDTGAEVVTLRGSRVTGHEGHAIAVHGNDSVLDLGTSGEVGDNELTYNKGVSLRDARPSAATGQITLHDTMLGGPHAPQPSAGTYGAAAIAPYDVEIVNDNEVVVY